MSGKRRNQTRGQCTAAAACLLTRADGLWYARLDARRSELAALKEESPNLSATALYRRLDVLRVDKANKQFSQQIEEAKKAYTEHELSLKLLQAARDAVNHPTGGAEPVQKMVQALADMDVHKNPSG